VKSRLAVWFFGGGVGGILGLGDWGALGAFGLVDCGKSFDIEAFVVGVADGFVDVKAFDQEDADANVDFRVGGQPDFAVEIGMLENERVLIGLEGDF
jgi:hypothetical protein